MSSNHNAIKAGIALLLIIVIQALTITALSTEYWIEGGGSRFLPSWNQGLWKICSENGCSGLEADSLPAWYKAVQAGVCLGLIFLSFSIAPWTLFLSGKMQSRQKLLRNLTLGLLFLSYVWIMEAIVVWGAENEGTLQSLGWSWGLAVAAMVLEHITVLYIACTDWSFKGSEVNPTTTSTQM